MTKKKKKVETVLGFTSVEVLGHTISVEETTDTTELLVNNQLCYGLFSPLESKIVISTNQSAQNIKQTFYHELLHAIDWLSHNEEYKYDEEVVNVLGRGLSTVRID